jgi:hypothetical protein
MVFDKILFVITSWRKLTIENRGNFSAVGRLLMDAVRHLAVSDDSCNSRSPRIADDAGSLLGQHVGRAFHRNPRVNAVVAEDNHANGSDSHCSWLPDLNRFCFLQRHFGNATTAVTSHNTVRVPCRSFIGHVSVGYCSVQNLQGCI